MQIMTYNKIIQILTELRDFVIILLTMFFKLIIWSLAYSRVAFFILLANDFECFDL